MDTDTQQKVEDIFASFDKDRDGVLNRVRASWGAHKQPVLANRAWAPAGAPAHLCTHGFNRPGRGTAEAHA